jgi:hypothetical protein
VSAADSIKKRAKKRPAYVWVLFVVLVVLPSNFWAWFIVDQSFVYAKGPIPLGWFIRQILIAFLPLILAVYAG